MAEKQWYILQARPNTEKKVMATLQERISRSSLADRFGQILVPEETIEDIKDGVRKQSTKKMYPGYIFLELDVSDDVWHLVRNVPNVLGCVGGKKTEPVPVPEKDMSEILRRMQESQEAPRPKKDFQVGQVLELSSGPFTGFSGVIEQVNHNQQKLRLSVTIFGRSTPVDIDFNDVEKST